MNHAENANNLLESIRLDAADIYEQTARARELRTALAEIHALLAIADAIEKVTQSHHFAAGSL